MAKHDAEVRALLAVPFFEIGTHGQVHAHLPDLDESQQRREILNRSRSCARGMAYPLHYFVSPYGEYNEATVSLAKALISFIFGMSCRAIPICTCPNPILFRR